MIVDRMLPGLDGLGIVKTARAAGVTTPVLFLTTMGGIEDRATNSRRQATTRVQAIHCGFHGAHQ